MSTAFLKTPTPTTTLVTGPELFEQQERGLRRLHELDGGAGLFMEMGTGKTRTALVFTTEKQCRRVLVVCPLGVVGVWQREMRLIGYPLPVIDLTAVNSVKERADALLRMRGHDGIVLVNYESYWREPLRSAIVKWEPQAVILDEAHRIRHRGAKLSSFAHVFPGMKSVAYRIALTGTPITNGLEDAYSIYKFIDPRVFGTRWADFAARYLTLDPRYPKKVKGYQNVPLARELIARTSFQCPKDEAKLPPRGDYPVPVRLDPGTRDIYDELRRKAIVEVEDARGQPKMVVARIAMVLLLRLQQVASGFSREVGGETIEISTEKAQAALDLIDSALAGGERVVVFARFLHDLDLLDRMLPKDVRRVQIRGGQTAPQRTQIQKEFSEGKYDVILAQIRTASLGIDLTAASVAIFFSVGFSLDDFQQAKDRLHRTGQTRPVRYYHLLGESTVDSKVYGALTSKMNIAARLTDLSYAIDMFH